MPVFASNWCLRTRSARVSASSWMSISSNKSSHTKLEGVCSQQRLRQHLGWTFDTRVCGACDARRERMGRVRSARCNIFYSLAGERFSGVRCMRRRAATTSGVDFSTGDAVGLGRRAAACWNSPSGSRAQSQRGARGEGRSRAFLLGRLASSSRLVASKQRARCEVSRQISAE